MTYLSKLGSYKKTHILRPSHPICASGLPASYILSIFDQLPSSSLLLGTRSRDQDKILILWSITGDHPPIDRLQVSKEANSGQISWLSNIKSTSTNKKKSVEKTLLVKENEKKKLIKSKGYWLVNDCIGLSEYDHILKTT